MLSLRRRKRRVKWRTRMSKKRRRKVLGEVIADM